MDSTAPIFCNPNPNPNFKFSRMWKCYSQCSYTTEYDMWPYDKALTTTHIQILHCFQHTLFLWTGPTTADPGLDEPVEYTYKFLVDPIQEIDMYV